MPLESRHLAFLDHCCTSWSRQVFKEYLLDREKDEQVDEDLTSVFYLSGLQLIYKIKSRLWSLEVPSVLRGPLCFTSSPTY